MADSKIKKKKRGEERRHKLGRRKERRKGKVRRRGYQEESR